MVGGGVQGVFRGAVRGRWPRGGRVRGVAVLLGHWHVLMVNDGWRVIFTVILPTRKSHRGLSLSQPHYQSLSQVYPSDQSKPFR